MDFLLALIVTVAVVAIVVVCAIYIFKWMALSEPWSMIVRIIMGLVALFVLVGFVTGKIPLIRISL